MNAHRCDELLDAWRDHGDEIAAAELDRLLRTDPEARARYRHLMLIEAGIHHALRAAPGASAAGRTRRGDTGRRSLRRASQRHRIIRPDRHRAVVVAIAAAVVCAIAVTWATREGPRPAPTARREPTARAASTDDIIAMRTGTGADVPVHAGEAIASGATPVHLVLRADGTRIGLAAATSATLVPERGGERLLLTRGRMSAEVTPRTAERPFMVVTPQATATVVGTAFAVDVTDSSTVTVDHGTVVVAAGGVSERLTAGDGAWCGQGETPRVARRVERVLSELATPAAWSVRSSGMRIAAAGPGMLGEPALRADFTAVGGEVQAWMAATLAAPIDVSRYTGISIALTGPGIGKRERLLLEVLDADSPQPPDATQSYADRFVADVVDDMSGFAGWYEVRRAFSDFRLGRPLSAKARLTRLKGLMVLGSGPIVSIGRIALY